MRIHAFDYPKAQGEPAMGKSIHRNHKMFVPIVLKQKYCGRKNKTLILKETTSYVSLSDHPPIIDKKPLVGGESILCGNA